MTMPESATPPHQQQAGPDDGKGRSPSTGFGGLSRTLVRRTTDLIVIGVVAITLLNVGRKLTDWWRTSPDDLTSLPRDTAPFLWDDPQGILLDLADLPVRLQHQRLTGDERVIRDALIAQCRQRFESDSRSAPVTAMLSQRRLLEQLANREPVWRGDDDSRVHLLEGPCLLFAGSRPADSDSTIADGSTGHRLLSCLVFAFPCDAGQWAVFTIHPQPPETDAVVTAMDEVPLPAGARRMLSLQDVAGSRLLGFAGAGPVESWREELDESLSRQGWMARGDWLIHDAACSRGYVAQDDPRRQIDIQLVRREDVWTGLVHLAVSGE